MKFRIGMFAVVLAAAGLAGCKSQGDLVIQQNVGITALRTTCPAVGIPDHTGDITLFNQSGTQTVDALDVTATITNVRSNCDDSGAEVVSRATFDVQATRRNTAGARTVTLPYFASVLRGGDSVVSKRLGTVTLTFADGQARASASGTAGAVVNKAEASLPPEIRTRLERTRRAGDADAAIDPMSAPEVRAAIARATFELLIGFQLTEDQLAYNATR
jgi:hypothetical protein